MNDSSRHPLAKALLRLSRTTAPIYARSGRLPATHNLWDRVAFAAKLNSVDDAPEPLRDAMRSALHSHDTIQLLIFGPSQRTIGEAGPASLMAILEREWIIVTFCEDAGTQIYRCDFDDTLLLEMTDILLYGKLRVHFCSADRVHSVAIFFNTVMTQLYQQAIQLLLEGMDKPRQLAFREGRVLRAAVKDLPLKFKNGVANYLPDGQRVLELIHSPAVLRRRLAIFQRELSPEGVLVLTDKQLLFIAEEAARSGRHSYETAKYGYVVTYCPLSRIDAVDAKERQFLAVIEVKIRGVALAFCFSPEKRAAVTALVDSTTTALADRRRLVLQGEEAPSSDFYNAPSVSSTSALAPITTKSQTSRRFSKVP
jgi:hypothetical protein